MLLLRWISKSGVILLQLSLNPYQKLFMDQLNQEILHFNTESKFISEGTTKYEENRMSGKLDNNKICTSIKQLSRMKCVWIAAGITEKLRCSNLQ